MQLTLRWHKTVVSSFPTTVTESACSGAFPTGPRALSFYSSFVLCLGFKELLKTAPQKGLVLHWQSRYVDQAQQSVPRVLGGVLAGRVVFGESWRQHPSDYTGHLFIERRSRFTHYSIRRMVFCNPPQDPQRVCRAYLRRISSYV
jgi:hypothetical protein